MRLLPLMLFGLLTCALSAPRAEIVEEVVAWVNGDIITKSDLEKDEKIMIADLYRRYAGEELDMMVKEFRERMLINMIDRRILLHHALRIADLSKMGDSYLEMFKQQQGLVSEDDVQQLLEREKMSLEELRETLIEMFAPEDVLRAEVGSRVSVGDAEVEAFYAEHESKFTVPGEVTIREIVLLNKDAISKKKRLEEARRIREQAETGDFAQVAKEYSEAGTREGGGLLGPLKRGDLSQELETAAFTLPAGGVSEVMQMKYGFHIIKVESRSGDHVTPLDEIREQLRAKIENDKFMTEIQSFKDKARADAEWCVKDKYDNRIPEDVPQQTCQSL